MTNNDWRLYSDSSYLAHHGVLGQKWGIRRYQDKSGNLTAAGKKRYGEKVTMHNGKYNLIFGSNRYQSHKEYTTANKFAKASYKQRQEEINESRRKSKAGFLEKNARYIGKSIDNRKQLDYELARNRTNAGSTEFKRDVAVRSAKRAAAATAVVGAGIVAGMLHANYLNHSSKRKAAGALTMKGMDNYYEYSVGKKEIAKYIGKAVAAGALAGAADAITRHANAIDVVDRYDREDKKMEYKYGKNPNGDSRKNRAKEDEKKWKKGQV